MTVKELKKVLETVDENNEVVFSYSSNKVNGYYVDESDDKKTLVLTYLNVMPRV